MRRAMIAMLAAGALACGGSPATAPVAQTPVAPAAAPASAPAPAADGPATVQFKVFAQEGAGQRSVAPGTTMKSGDKLAMSVTVDRPVYVYVMQFFPDGTSAVLFPAGGEDNRVATEMRLPPAGWFQLDDVVGQENVYVVAATRPLSEADAAVKATVDDVRVSGSTASAPVPEPTPTPEPTPDPATDTPPKPKPKPKPRKRPKPTHGVAQAHGTGSGAPAATPRPVGRANLRTRGLTRVDDDGAGLTVKTDDQGVAIFQFSFEHAAR